MLSKHICTENLMVMHLLRRRGWYILVKIATNFYLLINWLEHNLTKNKTLNKNQLHFSQILSFYASDYTRMNRFFIECAPVRRSKRSFSTGGECSDLHNDARTYNRLHIDRVMLVHQYFKNQYEQDPTVV